jgi:regulator of sigma E protease
LVDTAIIRYDKTLEKVFAGFLHSYNLMAYNIGTLKYLIVSSFKQNNFEAVSYSVSGPVGIYSIINDLVKTSGKKLVTNILNVIALLSLSLAMMNVLPFPALDGGRMVFVLYEWISRKKVDQNVEKYVNLIGFLFLIILAILVSINDLIKLIK